MYVVENIGSPTCDRRGAQNGKSSNLMARRRRTPLMLEDWAVLGGSVCYIVFRLRRHLPEFTASLACGRSSNKRPFAVTRA